MTVLITAGGQRLESGGPYQLTSAGRRSIAQGSYQFAGSPGMSSLDLVGEGQTISFSRLYRTQPWIAAAVNKRYRPTLRLPLKVYERDSQGNKQRVRTGPLVDLVTTPWKGASQAQFKWTLFGPVLVHGNSVLAKERRSPGAPPSGFRPLSWRCLRPIIEEHTLYGWETSEFGPREFLMPEDVLHLRWWAPDSPVGVSPLEQLGVTVRIEDAAQRHQASLLGHAARPGGTITIPAGERVSPDDKADMKAAVERLSTPENAGRVWFMTNGAQWQPVGFTAHEAELIDQRKVAREEVAAVYDMPPPLIGILDHATYSNIDTQRQMLYQEVLGPDIVLAEQELQSQVIDGEPAFQGQFVEFDLAGVLRGNKLEEIQAIREAIGSALMTPNEGRGILNLPQAAPGDEQAPANQLYYPANNLAPLGAPPRIAATGDVVKAYLGDAARRMASKMGAGQDPWDRARFVRELTAALDGKHQVAEQWADAVEAVLARVTEPRDLLAALSDLT